MIRLQKFLADAGVASRRASERLIAEGQVSVNGVVIRELGTKVDPANVNVSVNGKVVRPKKKFYIALNKPAGYLCTRSDPQQRKVVHDLLPRQWASLQTVGRLDFETEGLIFLTNDGDFSLKLTHPRYGIRKHYLAEVEGRFHPDTIQRLLKGITDEGEVLRAQAIRILESNNTHSLLDIELTEGKYREVRRLLEAVGHPVSNLRRTQIGPIKIGELPNGRWRVLSAAEVKSLLPAAA
jgi:23S rRNA pseudouridine2605 synthase